MKQTKVLSGIAIATLSTVSVAVNADEVKSLSLETTANQTNHITEVTQEQVDSAKAKSDRATSDVETQQNVVNTAQNQQNQAQQTLVNATKKLNATQKLAQESTQENKVKAQQTIDIAKQMLSQIGAKQKTAETEQVKAQEAVKAQQIVVAHDKQDVATKTTDVKQAQSSVDRAKDALTNTTVNSDLNKAQSNITTKTADVKTATDAQAKADATNAQLQKDYQAKLALYNQALKAKAEADKQSINNVAFDIKAQAKGVDNAEYGNSIMTAKTKPDGSFEFNHDMIDGVKTIGYGKLTGKVNHHYVANKDGSVTAFVDSITLYKYEYRNVAQNAAVNQNIAFRVLTKDGQIIFEKKHNGNKTFAETLNKTLQLNLKYELKPHGSSGSVEVFKIHDDWVHDTHGSALVSYVNNNDVVPNVVIPKQPTPPSTEKVTPEAEKPVPEKPVEPKFVTPTLKTYTPAQPKVKPHVSIPEKINYSVSVHPVLVPAANPSKAVIDEAGQSVNGKTVLPNAELNYVAKQDFSQYKGMTASQGKIAKNFVFIDDYKDDALDGKSMKVNSIKASDGTDVSQLLEMRHVLSTDTLDEKLQTLIKEAGISPVGEFYMWTAKDPQAFYKAYVQKGLDVTYNLSFKVKKEFTKGQIQNGVAQIDFGNGYTGNIVVNDLTTPEIHKDVLDKEDGKSINNGTVKLGDEVTYKLEGWVVPTGRSYDLFEYKFVDQLQRTHDLYLRDKVVAKVDVTLKDGTVIKKGTNLGEYTETVYNKKTGLYELVFKKDFLEKVARSSEFGADDFVVVKRIKAGDVYNTADFFINGNKVKTETVVTHTPEKPKPVEPQKATPKAPAKGLPQTGEASVAPLTALGAIILSAIGLAGFKKRKEN